MTVSIKKSIELETPAYYEWGGISKIEEDKIINVTDSDLKIEDIGMVDCYLQHGIPTTEAAFNNAFQKALSKWNELDREISLEKHLEDREPEEEQPNSVADDIIYHHNNSIAEVLIPYFDGYDPSI